MTSVLYDAVSLFRDWSAQNCSYLVHGVLIHGEAENCRLSGRSSMERIGLAFLLRWFTGKRIIKIHIPVNQPRGNHQNSSDKTSAQTDR